MAIILFDNEYRKKLFPLTANKAVADLRMGILRIKEWWQLKTNLPVFIFTEKYLQPLYAPIPEGEHFWIDASVLPTEDLINRIFSLQNNEALSDEEGLIAGKLNLPVTHFNNTNSLQLFSTIFDIPLIQRLQNAQQIVQRNDLAIREDFKMICKEKKSQAISLTNQVFQQADIFIEEGACVEYSILNSTTGPIYIGKNANVMEGCIIRGPFTLGENATLKMGTKIYGATTIGNNCVAGGEIKNSILMGYSNKAHDGYLGDSIIGEWCNLGAGTTNSNVKNNASIIKAYNFYNNHLEIVGQKCGIIMGDYCTTAINSCINTGSVFGICCNVFGEGLLPKFINHFSWGTNTSKRYKLDKALQNIDNWKKLKNASLTNEEVNVLKYIFEQINQHEKV